MLQHNLLYVRLSPVAVALPRRVIFIGFGTDVFGQEE